MVRKTGTCLFHGDLGSLSDVACRFFAFIGQKEQGTVCGVVFSDSRYESLILHVGDYTGNGRFVVVAKKVL